MKICKCGEEISAARLIALPKATECVKCSKVEIAVGLMVWDHKTAPYIEVNTKTAKDNAGRKHAYGPHFRFSPREGRVAESAMSARSLHELGERLRQEKRQEPDPDANVEAIISNPSKCHPDRPRIGPSNKCLECALASQAQRIKR